MTAGAMTAMTGRRAAPVLALAGSAAVLGAASLTWVQGRFVAAAATGSAELAADGADLAPAVPALALVAAAAAAALLLAGPTAARLLAVLLGGCGAAILALVASVLVDPRPALSRVAGQQSAVTTVEFETVGVRPLAATALLGGLLLLGSAAAAWRITPSRSAAASRFDRTSASPESPVRRESPTRPGAAQDGVTHTWAALDRGEDPTRREPGSARPSGGPTPPSGSGTDLPE